MQCAHAEIEKSLRKLGMQPRHTLEAAARLRVLLRFQQFYSLPHLRFPLGVRRIFGKARSSE